MNFEELQSIWADQPSKNAPTIAATEVKRVILPEIKRRRRMLNYALFVVVLSLVILPILFVINYRYAPPALPVWHGFYHGVWMAALGVLLIAIGRATKRQGSLRKQCSRSWRDLTVAALASSEAEITGYRKALFIVPFMIVFQLTNLYLVFAAEAADWVAFGTRAAIVVGLPAAIGVVVWRHYCVNLKPARDRQHAQLLDMAD